MDIEERKEKLRKSAEDLSRLPLELIGSILNKANKAIIEEMLDIVDEKDTEIANLKKTVGTLISYLHRELGTKAAEELLEMLDEKD